MLVWIEKGMELGRRKEVMYLVLRTRLLRLFDMRVPEDLPKCGVKMWVTEGEAENFPKKGER